MKTIALKINVNQIDKARLFKGEKGTYLDAVLFLNDEADQYGNHGMITQSVSKDERQAGMKGNILGNCKIVGAASTPAASQTSKQTVVDPLDDLPF
jgi:hypothetical protein